MSQTEELFQAIVADDQARVRALLQADPALAAARNGAGLSAVLSARYRFRTGVLDLLLAARPELDLFDASAVGDHDRLATLLDGQPDQVNAEAADGFYPLGLAAFFAQRACALVLLERGANPNQVAGNATKIQPLHAAAAGRNREIVEALVQRGADVNARQNGGFTPLHAAAQNGDRVSVDLLLAAGADPGAKTDDGRAAAGLAAEAGHTDLWAHLQGAMERR